MTHHDTRDLIAIMHSPTLDNMLRLDDDDDDHNDGDDDEDGDGDDDDDDG